MPAQIDALSAALGSETNAKIMPISAVSGDGLQVLFDVLAAQIDANAAPASDTSQSDTQNDGAPSEGAWHPLQEQ
jgi:hypothetical protein